jgi:predicted  nucleic acid-binding Zn-ribbon protein
MKEIENDVKQLEEEVSSLVDQVIALRAELESHERLIVKKDQTIADLHSWSKKLEEDQVKKDKTIEDLHGVLVAAK